METIALATTGRRTTRLGFGCSGIAGGLERRRSLGLLEAAYDAGIRHFDVAPMYGYDTAEAVLGLFLRRHPDATVTTKFGVRAEAQSFAKRTLRAMAKRVLPAALTTARPGLPRPLNADHVLGKEAFTHERARESLQHSSRFLQREQIDLFLLHECTAAELVDPTLLDALHTWTYQHRIGAFGVGSTAASLPTLLAEKTDYCAVVQSEWSAFEPALVADRRFHVTHRALQCPWRDGMQRLLMSPEALLSMCAETDCDLADAAMWPKLLLRAALLVHADTVVLFSTRDVRRVQANCEAAFDSKLDRAAVRLHEFLSSSMRTLRPATDAYASGGACRL